MPHYKVCYLAGRGRGEIIRLTLAQAGVDYEDFRFSFEEWHSKYRAIAPFGLTPWLEVDGKKLGQSMACSRYIARKHDMMGSNEWEEGQVNAVCDAFEDVMQLVVGAYFSESEETKKEAAEKLPGAVKKIEEVLGQNDGGSGYFVGKTVTLADLRSADMMENFIVRKHSVVDEVVLLKAHYDRICELPNIKAWIEKRPPSAF